MAWRVLAMVSAYRVFANAMLAMLARCVLQQLAL